MRAVTLLILLASALLGRPAAAQTPVIAQAIRAGQVGEKYDGYMGLVSAPSAELRRQVAAINLRRRNLYIELSTRRNVNPQLVGMATACQLFAQLAVGEAYMLSDGVWRRRQGGQPVPLPDYCR
jgi:uncharacterized protein YdbL (DUF1318 family)